MGMRLFDSSMVVESVIDCRDLSYVKTVRNSGPYVLALRDGAR